MNPTTLLTSSEAAEKLRISLKTLKRMRLPVVRIGVGKGKLFYRDEDLERYIRTHVEYRDEDILASGRPGPQARGRAWK